MDEATAKLLGTSSVKLFVLSVRDARAEAFGQVFTVPAVGLAIRELEQAVNDGKSAMARNPADFSLYQLGRLDTSSGVLYPQEPEPLLLVNCRQLVDQQPLKLEREA